MMPIATPTLSAVIAIGAVAVLTACGSSSPATPPQASLRVMLEPTGADGPHSTWAVACPSATQTAACARLFATTEAFTPPPANGACTMIYGGPQVLSVTGNVGDRRVTYHTGRTNGCQIADYERDLALVAPFRPSATSSG